MLKKTLPVLFLFGFIFSLNAIQAEAATFDYYTAAHYSTPSPDPLIFQDRRNDVVVNGATTLNSGKSGFTNNEEVPPGGAQLQGIIDVNAGTLKSSASVFGNNVLGNVIVGFGDTITLFGPQSNTPVQIDLTVDGDIQTTNLAGQPGASPARTQIITTNVTAARGQQLDRPEVGVGVEENTITAYAKPFASFAALDPLDQLAQDINFIVSEVSTSTNVDGPINDGSTASFIANSVGDFTFQIITFLQIIGSTADLQTLWTADFLNTVGLSITVPTGTSFSSASGGSFIRTASSSGATVIPEPATMAMLGLGLAGFGFRRKFSK